MQRSVRAKNATWIFKTLLAYLIVGFLCVNSASAIELSKVDKELASYTRNTAVSGALNSIGSDTLNNLMTLWAEGFSKHHPGVKVQIEGKGSSTAPPALISGTAQLGPMSRAMKNTEIDKFQKKFGYKPTPVKVAVDALAVFVHKDNPIKGLTLEQVDAIFSKSRRLGMGKSINTWTQLGLKTPWANKPISIYGRNSASGTYGFFKKKALGNGDYKDQVKEQPGSASVVQSVSVDIAAVGYSGIGYQTAGVKAIPLSKTTEKPFVEPSSDNAFNGTYPLARFLYVYVNKKPGEKIDPLTKEFLAFVLSKQGQTTVVKDGYYPLSSLISSQELAKL